MMAAPARQPQPQPQPQGRSSSSRGLLLGMYALLAAALASVGASAGNLFFTGDRSLSLPFAESLNRCAVRFPVTGYLSGQVAARNRCLETAYKVEGWWVLGAAVAVPLLTAGLVFVVPWLDRWRLARAGRWADVPGATDRFGLLCAEAGLTGRLRPRLQVAGLTIRQAFTTALPGGRPLVVIPVKTAVSFRDPRRFDPVLLHELAHVRARDVSWVSAVRGLAIVTVPVLALASAPEILDGASLLAPRTFLIQAFAFVACSLLLAAELLRRREIEADRQAVRWLGSAEMLSELLAPAGGPTGARTARWPGPLARHPSLTARLTALRDPSGVLDSGFAYALAAGAITAMVMNTSYFIAWTFDYSVSGFLPVRVSAAAGALMLGLGLTPGLLHRCARARAAGVTASWWQPVAGTALGLFVGSLIPPGTATGAVISFFLGQGWTGVAVAAILACLGAGVVMLTIGLASLATATGERLPAWVTASLTAVMSCCAAAALFPVFSFNFSEAERLYLAFVLPDDQWRWLALLYPVAVVTLAARTAARRGLARAVAAELVLPVLAATVTAALFFPHDRAAANASAVTAERLGQEQWWAAVLAGLVVLVVLAAGRGIPGLARACVAAWLTTLLVGVERAAYGAVTGGGLGYLGKLPSLLATPSVWLFYLALPAACAALIGGHVSAALTRRWAVPAAACAGAAATALVVFSTGIPGLFVPLVAAAQVPVQGSDLSHPAKLTGTGTPSGVLTTTAERMIITRVGEALPGNWTTGSAASGGAPAGPTTVTPAACVPFVDGGYLKALPRPLAQAQGQYKILPGYLDGSETLEVTIDSYPRPVPAALFAAADRDVRACHRYTISDSALSVTATVREVAVHGLPVPAWRAQVSILSGAASASITWVEMGIGHNLVILDQETNLTGPLAQPDETVIDAAVRAITPAPALTPLPLAAGRPLTQAAANRVAGAAAASLGSSWAPGSLPSAAPAHVTYQPAACASLAHQGFLNMLPRPLARAEDRYESAPALADDGVETLSVRVESFSQPVPASLLTTATRIFDACPRYTALTSGSHAAEPGSPSLATTHAILVPGLGFPQWRGDIFIALHPGSGSATWIMIAAGHNLVFISQQTISTGSGSRPDEKVIAAAVAATVDALET